MRPPEEFAELERLLSRSPYIAHEATDGVPVQCPSVRSETTPVQGAPARRLWDTNRHMRSMDIGLLQ